VKSHNALSAHAYAVSTGFHWLKIASLQMVIAGHFWTKEASYLWIPTTTGLMIFGFVSSYYTVQAHEKTSSITGYWGYKAKGFYPFYWFLSALVLLIEATRSGNWSLSLSPHTVVHLLGLTGFLNWFGIHNTSVLGNALWFLTVLILSWLLYPLLKKAYFQKAVFYGVTFMGGAIAMIVTVLWPMGHMLAMTVWGFLLGAVLGALPKDQPVPFSFFGKIILSNGGFLLAFLMIDQSIALVHLDPKPCITLFFTFIIALGLLYSAMRGFFKGYPVVAIRLSSWGLALYILHVSLFWKPFENAGLNYGVSVALCFIVSAVCTEAFNKTRAYCYALVQKFR
jgi:hypothetical protein